MENIAYLHLASTYQNPETAELISIAKLLRQTVAPQWYKLSGKGWIYLLPVALSLSIINNISYVFAQEIPPALPSTSESAFYPEQITPEQTQFQQVEIQPVNNTIITINSTSANIIPSSSKRQKPGILQKGDEGEDVRILQQHLAIAGFYYGNPTGVFGPITQESVKRFQKAYNLKPDGIVGKSTQAKLKDLNPTNDSVTNNKSKENTSNYHTLSLGDRGESVRILQEQLIKAGFFKGSPNGYYGSYTVDAVTRFQKQYQLEINGQANNLTRAKLYNLVKTSSASNFTTLEIQQRLQKLGFYKGEINGTMADDTKKALKRAQRFYGISLSDIKGGNL